MCDADLHFTSLADASHHEVVALGFTTSACAACLGTVHDPRAGVVIGAGSGDEPSADGGLLVPRE